MPMPPTSATRNQRRRRRHHAASACWSAPRPAGPDAVPRWSFQRPSYRQRCAAASADRLQPSVLIQIAEELVVGTQPIVGACDLTLDLQQTEQLLTLIDRHVAIQERTTAETLGQEDRQVDIGWCDSYPLTWLTSLVLEI